MSRILPAILMVMGLGSLSLMDAFVKMLGADYPVWQITFMRYLLGAVVVLPLVVVFRPPVPNRSSLRANMLRGVVMLTAAYCFFQALQFIPMALATSLFFTAPLIIVILGAIFLNEPVTKRAFGAIAVGLVGVAIICGGSLSGEHIGADVELMAFGLGLALFGAVCYAIAVVTIRARAQNESVINIILLQSIASAVVATPFGVANWQPVAAGDWGLFLALGLCGSAGFLALSNALKRAPVAKLAPLEYSAFLWASLWGYLFFAEMPGITTLAGAVLIVAAGLMVIQKTASSATFAAKDTV